MAVLFLKLISHLCDEESSTFTVFSPLRHRFIFGKPHLKKLYSLLLFGIDFAYCELELLLQITPLDKKNGGFDDTELQVLDDSSTKSTKNVETNTEMPKSKNFKLQVGQNLKLTILKGGDRKKSHQVCLVI